MKLHSILATVSTLTSVTSFAPMIQTSTSTQRSRSSQSYNIHYHAPMTKEAEAEATTSFIATELRGAAMKLHTKMQAPKEGQAKEAPKPREPYTPTHLDYLKFLVDSQYVYQTFENVLQNDDLQPELTPFLNTGLERAHRLEEDIAFISSEYDVERPEVGDKGKTYGDLMASIAAKGKDGIPEFMCHYYNYYFAHTAGGRMIGKQMAALLLEKKTLEFYKWDGNVNEIKDTVKSSIEEIAATWSREQKDQCVDATAAAFMGGGGINAYLSGGRGGHH